MTIQLESVALDEARWVIAAGEEKAQEIGSPSNIAVVDAGGNLVAHIRMDGAWIGSINISTRDSSDNAQPGQQFFGLHESNSGRVMIFAGGIPLQRDGQVIGAVGVSGGTGEQDQTVAEAAVAAF